MAPYKLSYYYYYIRFPAKSPDVAWLLLTEMGRCNCYNYLVLRITLCIFSPRSYGGTDCCNDVVCSVLLLMYVVMYLCNVP